MNEDGRYMGDFTYRVYEKDPMVCPKCGATFDADMEDELVEYDPQGWNEFRHECDCGHTIRYFEVFKFSHYEVYDE